MLTNELHSLDHLVNCTIIFEPNKPLFSKMVQLNDQKCNLFYIALKTWKIWFRQILTLNFCHSTIGTQTSTFRTIFWLGLGMKKIEQVPMKVIQGVVNMLKVFLEYFTVARGRLTKWNLCTISATSKCQTCLSTHSKSLKNSQPFFSFYQKCNLKYFTY